MSEGFDVSTSVEDPSPATREPAAGAPHNPTGAGVQLFGTREASVVDSTGRIIKVIRRSALDRMRMFRAAGPENSDNRSWMIYATLASMVTEIGGIKYPMPSSVIQIEAMVQTLDDHGIEAVAAALNALAPPEKDVAAAAKNL